MDFELSNQQKMIRKVVREFVKREILPYASLIDRECHIPNEIFKKLARMGFFGLVIPQKYSGAGLDTVSYAICIDELSKACASTGVTICVHNSVAAYPIYLFGTEAQKRKYLIPMAKGRKIGAFALTEPNAGSDAANVQTNAVLKGDEWVINGTKIFITNGSIAKTVLVFARTDTDFKNGVSVFIVEKGTPGFSIGVIEEKLGINGSDTAELIFEDCRIPKENLLGQLNNGYRMALQILDSARIGIAAQGVGIAQAALDASVKYANEREQFGQKIANFQAIQWWIADMATEIDAARLLTYRAAFLKDKGVRFSKQASMAKLFAAETAMKAAEKAVQIHGGYGYCKDYPVERFFRDAKIVSIYEGTSEVQRLKIAYKVLGL
ncbi:MAG: acyl-CoA dehydrogenase [Promethearchaeota archaeon]